MFIVRFLIVGTSATMGFYSRTERRGNRHVAVETEKERAWGCVHCEKTRLASISLVCELLFTTLFIQGTYLNCEKWERKGRGRKIIKLTR
jgi:hypothetical protein